MRPHRKNCSSFKLSSGNAKPPAKKAPAPKLLNLTNDDAERLQAHWNAKAEAQHKERKAHGDFEPSAVVYMTQAKYSAISKGTYAHAGTVEVCEDGYARGRANAATPVACKLRKMHPSGYSFYKADRIIVLTDKPQQPLPFALEPEAATSAASDSSAASEQASLFPVDA